MTIVGAQGFRAEHAAGADRLREGERRERHLRQCRRRRRLAALRPALHGGDRHQGDRGSLSGHRPGADRPRRRPGRLHVRPDHEHGRPDQGRARSRPMPSPRRSAIRRCRTCRPRRKAGLPDLDVSIWHGLYVPKGTPAEALQKLNEALKAALKDPDGRRRASPSSAPRRCRRTSPRRRRIASACSRRSSCGSRSSRRPACSRNSSSGGAATAVPLRSRPPGGVGHAEDRVKDLLAGLVFIAFGLAFAIAASRYQLGTAFRMGPGYFPVVLGGCLVLLGVLIVVEGIVAGERGAIGAVPWRGDRADPRRGPVLRLHRARARPCRLALRDGAGWRASPARAPASSRRSSSPSA